MDWACDGRLLTVTIRGPWTLDTADMESALEVLLRDLRSRSLSPAKDEVEIVLASQPMDESVQLDAAWAERELIESLAPEAGIRGPSLFDTYDCAGGCWPFDNPLVVPEKRHEQ